VVGTGNTSVVGGSADLKLSATGQVAITTNTSVTGVVTATSFVGDGSGLTGVTAGIAGIATTGTSYFNGLNVSGSIFNGGTFYQEDSSNTTGVYSFGPSFDALLIQANSVNHPNVKIKSVQGDIVLEPSSPEINSGIVTTTSNLTVAGDINFTGDLYQNGSPFSGTITYTITANGSTAYRFAGPGIVNTVDNPTLYLQRGFTYTFVNTTTTAHPFRIQFTGTTTGVGTYVSGNQDGTQVFTIPHDAPASYQYQCTIHAGMLGTFTIPS